MFEGLFHTLRAEGVPVAMNEWLVLQEALERGLADNSLSGFYLVARSVLVKSERHYDGYDIAFERYFAALEPTEEQVADRIWDWLAERPEALRLTAEQKARLDELRERLDFDEIRRRLDERLRNQREAHHGGDRHIGTGGTSPFGHSGYHPEGFRIGGEGCNRSAVQVAGERRWRSYRGDATIGVREFSVALRRLRQLTTRAQSATQELDVEATIDATAEAGGRLELAFGRPRKNDVRVLLLLDVGGSMDDHARVCEQLFSAVHQANHFADLTVRYFHNCVYDRLYFDADMDPRRSDRTVEVLAQAGEHYKLVVVGDACMAPSELSLVGGAIDYYQHNDEPGWVWLERLADHFSHRVWLNPVPEVAWATVHGARTLNAVARLMPMFELSTDGLGAAVQELMIRR